MEARWIETDIIVSMALITSTYSYRCRMSTPVPGVWHGHCQKFKQILLLSVQKISQYGTSVLGGLTLAYNNPLLLMYIYIYIYIYI